MEKNIICNKKLKIKAMGYFKNFNFILIKILKYFENFKSILFSSDFIGWNHLLLLKLLIFTINLLLLKIKKYIINHLFFALRIFMKE